MCHAIYRKRKKINNKKKRLCPLTLCLLRNSYCSQKTRIRWNGASSDTFTICNGVKQGGVISPLLFNIYLDELLLKLEAQDWGAIVTVCSWALLSMLMTLLC